MAVFHPVRSAGRDVVSDEAAANDITAARAAFGVSFDDVDLLDRALTHPSASGPAGGHPESNQRLEFLGDRVLGLIVAARLHQSFPTEREGELARRFAALVDAATLAKVARGIGLGGFLRLGQGEAVAGRDNPANLADACEALIGALFLDGGLAKAEGFVLREWGPLIAGQESPPRDPKTTLQEWTQARGLGLPGYDVVERSGPAHAPTFAVSVTVEGAAPESARGSTKRAAERAAAAVLLARLTGTESDNE